MPNDATVSSNSAPPKTLRTVTDPFYKRSINQHELDPFDVYASYHVAFIVANFGACLDKDTALFLDLIYNIDGFGCGKRIAVSSIVQQDLHAVKDIKTLKFFSNLLGAVDDICVGVCF